MQLSLPHHLRVTMLAAALTVTSAAGVLAAMDEPAAAAATLAALLICIPALQMAEGRSTSNRYVTTSVVFVAMAAPLLWLVASPLAAAAADVFLLLAAAVVRRSRRHLAAAHTTAGPVQQRLTAAGLDLHRLAPVAGLDIAWDAGSQRAVILGEAPKTNDVDRLRELVGRLVHGINLLADVGVDAVGLVIHPHLEIPPRPVHPGVFLTGSNMIEAAVATIRHDASQQVGR